MDIFRSRFYRTNVVLLSLVGMWPYQKNKAVQLIQGIVSQFLVLTIMLAMSCKFFEVWGDLDIMIECFTPFGVHIGAVIKFVNCFVHRKKMVRLLETIRRDWTELRNETEIAILRRYAQIGRSVTIIYSGFLYVSVTMYLMIPMIPRILDAVAPLNESRPPAYLYQTEYFVDPEEYFFWILAHEYTGGMVAMTIIIAADTMFACYVMHVCGILAVLGHRMENLTSKRFRTDDDFYLIPKNEDEKCFREIVLCIDQHYRVTEVAKTIESCYSTSYLIVFGIAVVLLSCSAVQLLIKFHEIDQVIRLLPFNVGQCIHLLLSSWPCQKLMDQCDKFRESIYAAEWYSLSERNKRLLHFTMMRTLEPEKITAGKLYVMSMENFSVVMQTSVSYFTLFASLR